MRWTRDRRGPAADPPLPFAKSPPDPDGIPDLPGLDRDKVDELFTGDRDFFPQVLRGFVADYGAAVDAIEDALRRREFDGAAKILHKLRGSVGYLGTVHLAELSSTSEAVIKGRTTEVPRLLDEFGLAHKALVTAASRYVPP